jgi:hypothetical protein
MTRDPTSNGAGDARQFPFLIFFRNCGDWQGVFERVLTRVCQLHYSYCAGNFVALQPTEESRPSRTSMTIPIDVGMTRRRAVRVVWELLCLEERHCHLLRICESAPFKCPADTSRKCGFSPPRSPRARREKNRKEVRSGETLQSRGLRLGACYESPNFLCALGVLRGESIP